MPPEPTYFETPADLRAWFEVHGATERELWVGFRRKGSGRPSITWPEAVDEALCVGWIDGLKRTVDAESYTLRFTPRAARSTWSAVNIRRAGELIAEGRMRPAGLAAFEARTGERSGVYSFEQKDEIAFDEAQARRFQADAKAWEFFQAQPPWYRRTA